MSTTRPVQPTSTRPDGTEAFRYERHQHIQAIQIASDMFKTGMDSARKHGSQVEHGLAAGTGGALLSKAAAICGRMADGGRYNREDKAILARTIAALEAWVQDNTPNTYEATASLGNGNSLGPWKILTLSSSTAVKLTQDLLAIQGIKYESINIQRVEADP